MNKMRLTLNAVTLFVGASILEMELRSMGGGRMIASGSSSISLPVLSLQSAHAAECSGMDDGQCSAHLSVRVLTISTTYSRRR